MQQISRERHNSKCAAATIRSPCLCGNFSATSSWWVGLHELYRRFSPHI